MILFTHSVQHNRSSKNNLTRNSIIDISYVSQYATSNLKIGICHKKNPDIRQNSLTIPWHSSQNKIILRTDTLRAKIDWKSAFSKELVQFGPKFQVEGIVSSCQKTEWMNLIWYKNFDSRWFRFVTMHAFDGRQTDRQTDRRTDRFQ